MSSTKSPAKLAVIVALAVVVAGCAGLAGNSGESTPTPTETATATATDTAVEQSTAATETGTTTETATPTPTPTTTVAETPTSTETPTPTPSDTPTTETPTSEATETRTETPTETPTSAPTPSETETATATETETATDTSDMDQNHVVIRAVGDGESYYRFYTMYGAEFGDEADLPGEAEHPDTIVYTVENYVQGFVGEGGVDDYWTRADINPGGIINDGTATLKVYVNGELRGTVEPGANVEEHGEIGPSAPPQGERTLTIKAVGDGESYYTFSTTGAAYYGDTADPSVSADNPDSASWSGGTGFVGDGGVDSYSFNGDLRGFTNEGTATLKVYVDGELVTTVEPGEEWDHPVYSRLSR